MAPIVAQADRRYLAATRASTSSGAVGESDDERFEFARGEAKQPDATIVTDPATLAAVVYDGRDLAEAVRTEALRISGDMSAVERFLTLFLLPETAPACQPRDDATQRALLPQSRPQR